MDFAFNEEQEMLRESCRQFLNQEAPMLRVREMGEAGFRLVTDNAWPDRQSFLIFAAR